MSILPPASCLGIDTAQANFGTEKGAVIEKVKSSQVEKERAARLAQALRDNLRKRKEQARLREASATIATVLPGEVAKGDKPR